MICTDFGVCTITKSKYVSKEYNALFEEDNTRQDGLPPDEEIDRYKPNLNDFDNPDRMNPKGIDVGQACHLFAISSPISPQERKILHNKYEEIGNNSMLNLYKHGMWDKKITQDQLQTERLANMDKILKLRNEEETALAVNKMYLCGGFDETGVQPQHMWIEDRTNKVVYDTLISRHGVAIRNFNDTSKQHFASGCASFPEERILRVPVDGYTFGQLVAIAAGADTEEALYVTKQYVQAFPSSIANMEPVKEAEKAVARVTASLNIGGGREAALEAVYANDSRRKSPIITKPKEQEKPIRDQIIDRCKANLNMPNDKARRVSELVLTLESTTLADGQRAKTADEHMNDIQSLLRESQGNVDNLIKVLFTKVEQGFQLKFKY